MVTQFDRVEKCSSCPENCNVCSDKNSCEICKFGYEFVPGYFTRNSPNKETDKSSSAEDPKEIWIPARCKPKSRIIFAFLALVGILLVGVIVYVLLRRVGFCMNSEKKKKYLESRKQWKEEQKKNEESKKHKQSKKHIITDPQVELQSTNRDITVTKPSNRATL